MFITMGVGAVGRGNKILDWRGSWYRNSHTSGESVSATQRYPARIPLAPAFRGSPAAFVRTRKVCGGLGETSIAIARLCGGFVHGALAGEGLTLYTMAAWVTVLWLRPQVIPEFSTTRWAQRQAWTEGFLWAPGLVAGWMGLWLWQGHGLLFWGVGCWACGRSGVGVGRLLYAHFLDFLAQAPPAYLDEMLFRSLLQARFRRLGMPSWWAILLQASLFSTVWGLQTGQAGVAVSAFMIGLVNGHLAYRYRSLWPGFCFGWVSRILWLGGLFR